METRYRGVVLVGAGLPAAYRSYYPAANQINFSPHIAGPKLMVQGGHVPSVETMVSTISP